MGYLFIISYILLDFCGYFIIVWKTLNQFPITFQTIFCFWFLAMLLVTEKMYIENKIGKIKILDLKRDKIQNVFQKNIIELIPKSVCIYCT